MFLLFDTNNGVIAATVVVVVGGGAHVCTEIVQLEAPCFSLFWKQKELLFGVIGSLWRKIKFETRNSGENLIRFYDRVSLVKKAEKFSANF